MTIIHRDHTIWYNGEKYRVTRGGDYRSGFGWELWRDRDGKAVNDDFDYLYQIRQFVDACRDNGWPLIVEEA